MLPCIWWHVDASWCDSCVMGCKMLVGVSVWVRSPERERLPWLAGEGACPSGRPRNRLFSNVQLPIIPAVINHPTLTNEVEQSASQSATQHTTTHSPLPCCLGLSSCYHFDIIPFSYFECSVCSVLVVWSRVRNFGSENISFSRKLMWVTAIKSYVSNFYWFCRTPT